MKITSIWLIKTLTLQKRYHSKMGINHVLTSVFHKVKGQVETLIAESAILFLFNYHKRSCIMKIIARLLICPLLLTTITPSFGWNDLSMFTRNEKNVTLNTNLQSKNNGSTSMENFTFDSPKNPPEEKKSGLIRPNSTIRSKQLTSESSEKSQLLKQIDEGRNALVFEQKKYIQKERKLKSEIEQLKKQIVKFNQQQNSYSKNTLLEARSLPIPVSDIITQALHKIIPSVRPAELIQTPLNTLFSSEDAHYFPETLLQQQSYASGVLVGQDIKMMNIRNSSLGIQTDRQALLAGIKDSLSNRILFSERKLEEFLATLKESLDSGVKKFSTEQKTAGSTYRKNFSQQKGVLKSPKNFLYKVDVTGKKITNNNKNLIDMIVKESLIDGTVISDMTKTGAVISQKMEDYPPLFREAIKLAGIGGKITLVVPPEQAYGDAGKVPLIPPGATMIYQIQVY